MSSAAVKPEIYQSCADSLGQVMAGLKEFPPHVAKELGKKQSNSTAIKNGFENKERSYNL